VTTAVSNCRIKNHWDRRPGRVQNLQIYTKSHNHLPVIFSLKIRNPNKLRFKPSSKTPTLPPPVPQRAVNYSRPENLRRFSVNGAYIFAASHPHFMGKTVWPSFCFRLSGDLECCPQLRYRLQEPGGDEGGILSGGRVCLNRIATVISLLALIGFAGRSPTGITFAIVFLLLSLWISSVTSRIAYGRPSFLGPKRFKVPCMEIVPEWLQWLSFSCFLVTCALLAWSIVARVV
jgi:hypothetical protein